MIQFFIQNTSAIIQFCTMATFIAGFFIWTVRRSDKKFAVLEERIFQLAMGKTLKEAMMEERAK